MVLAGPVDSIDQINGVGDFVSVNGSVVSSGWLYADSVSVASSMYVPGATAVFVMGIPSKIDRVLAQAQIGELTIDYTAAMSGGAIPSGFSLSFSGIQPVSRGLLVSDAVSAVE
jgi:hypothetical protein